MEDSSERPSKSRSLSDESFADFFDNALSGFLITDGDGRILRANARFADWVGCSSRELVGTRFADHLPIGDKVFYETHLAPLIKMQGCFDEVALELAFKGGTRLPVFVNALEHRDDANELQYVKLSVFKAIDRRKYEQGLLEGRTAALASSDQFRQAVTLREQFMAILGHDLRNPLAAIDGGMRLISKTPLDDKAKSVVALIQQSIKRMQSLIDSTMDFARARLGGGITLDRRSVLLEPTIRHVVEEFRISFPGRTIETEVLLSEVVNCDAQRISQLLSNLVANALTHGAESGTVGVRAVLDGNDLVLTVSNAGEPIPPDALQRLFQPFTREDFRPSQQGLGLGLYIAFEIARAHGGKLEVTSTTEETRFTFRMPRWLP
jgi:sigma-B regulation protein RsbU (phosphoserine phosphatase)